MTDDATVDASRRTRLASERTQLAWWRTGLTALAVSLGVGRVLPELDPDSVTWPYVTLGTAFAVYGIALIVYGSERGRQVDRALDEGTFAPAHTRAIALLSASGALLGLACAVLILFG